MKNNRLVPAVMAVVGFGAIVVGIQQGLVHVAPGYEGTIVTGWDGALNHEEVLLVLLGGVGIGGTVAARKWKRLASIPVAMGGIVLFYVFRAVLAQFQSPHSLYREHSLRPPGSEEYTVMVVLGAEPFLLAVGGLLLVGAGVARSKVEPLSGTTTS
ncbi:hypothetical protein [Halorussus halophilus]|uniref:hypothetical protein n=1 Tax=Halorussus halophilus TaxID=2650975 RepID=UPI0013016954|nr:hypothetical protein [Halorussus halophilus]